MEDTTKMDILMMAKEMRGGKAELEELAWKCDVCKESVATRVFVRKGKKEDRVKLCFSCAQEVVSYSSCSFLDNIIEREKKDGK